MADQEDPEKMEDALRDFNLKAPPLPRALLRAASPSPLATLFFAGDLQRLESSGCM